MRNRLQKTNTRMSEKRSNQVTPTPTNTPPVVAVTDFVLYITEFTTILPDGAKRTALKTFLPNKRVTKPIFYLGSLLDNSSNRTLMRTLNTELNQLGITKRHANVTQSVNAINLSDSGTPAAYNVGCVTAAEKFTGFSQEWEFWKTNPYGDFATFKTNDLAIYNYCQANGLTYDIYVARCKDNAGAFTPEQVADWLVAYHDTIYLVDYVSTSKFNTYKGLSGGIKEQIQLIADAAKRANKVQKMSILWASEGNLVNGVATNMRTYFEINPTLIPAYNEFKIVFDKWKFNNSSSVKFTGQNLYGYDGVKDL